MKNTETQKGEENKAKVDIYGSGEKGKETEQFALARIQDINDALKRREEESVVFNGVSYTKGYEYNQKKALNYAPPRGNDDREVSLGLPHEKIVSFVSIFLKYVFKLEGKCYTQDGQLIERLGEVYELAIEFSRKLERFSKKIGVIYWELFSQGDAFILEDWDVRTIVHKVAKKDGEVLSLESIDFTYEFLEGLEYEEGKKVQTRRAVSRLLDGRQVILANPELDDANGGLQEQPHITIEEYLDRDVAEQIYGSLKMWESVPSEAEQITTVVGDNITLFNKYRLEDPKKFVIVHRHYDKVNNRFNIFVNGVMMLPKDTPFTLFYPRNNYPITQFSAERMSGSAYSRSVPAKVKFNADYADWVLKNLALRFEQDVDPALLVKGKYTLTKDIFKAGQRTHGVTQEDYTLARPDDRGMQQAHFSFLEILKDIMESQTVNPTTAGELSGNATATEIATVDNNQRDKLAFLLDGLMNGFIDLALRRAETIESKYTVKQRDTIIDGEKVAVYQNFSVSVAGRENVVTFDDALQNPVYDVESKRNELFKKAFDKNTEGRKTEFYLVNPQLIREGKYIIMFDVKTDRLKESALQLVQMKDEFDWLINTFPNVNREEMQKEYLEITGRSDDMFLPQELMELKAAEMNADGVNTGSLGKPTMKDALREQAMGYVR